MRRRDPVDRPEFLSSPTARALWTCVAPLLRLRGHLRTAVDAEILARSLEGYARWLGFREHMAAAGLDQAGIDAAGRDLLAKLQEASELIEITVVEEQGTAPGVEVVLVDREA